uniref:Uncharacterized protein n=1 Tax=Cacopsylla melanoneura TaxID=428564 RepID=A0A8D9AZU4_9HEMI
MLIIKKQRAIQTSKQGLIKKHTPSLAILGAPQLQGTEALLFLQKPALGGITQKHIFGLVYSYSRLVTFLLCYSVINKIRKKTVDYLSKNPTKNMNPNSQSKGKKKNADL